jgi:hypothetical protein
MAREPAAILWSALTVSWEEPAATAAKDWT